MKGKRNQQIPCIKATIVCFSAIIQWAKKMTTRLSTVGAGIMRTGFGVLRMAAVRGNFSDRDHRHHGHVVPGRGRYCNRMVPGWSGKGKQAFTIDHDRHAEFRLGIGIAATAFPGSPVLTTVLVYSFVAGLGVLGYAFLLRMGASGTD